MKGCGTLTKASEAGAMHPDSGRGHRSHLGSWPYSDRSTELREC